MSPVTSHPRPAAARHQFDELSPITITVDCPAKTNLTLEVGPAHDEWGGRHELDTIYCAIGVYDTVTATAKQPGHHQHQRTLSERHFAILIVFCAPDISVFSWN